MEIKKYPDFQPLAVSHKSFFDKAFLDDPPEISEFTFTNLYAWRQIYKLELSCLDGLIIVRSGSQTPERFFMPIGKGDVKKAVAAIAKDTNGVFFRVPESAVNLFSADPDFKAERDIDNSDYLFAAKDLIELAGRRYDGKRNLIKKFKENYSYEYIGLAGSNVKACLEFEDTWCLIKDCDSVEGLNNERQAFREMISNFSGFGLIGGAIKINNAIAAAAIAERLNPDTLVMHILKADPEIPGLYQTMMNDFISREGGAFKYVNLEQDLGVEGLRKAKASYHPVRMINKYKLFLNAQ